MAALGLLCVIIGIAAPTVVSALDGVVAAATSLAIGNAHNQLSTVAGSLNGAVSVFAVLVVIAVFAWAVRFGRLAVAGIRCAQVWGCGYLRPTARMQYTASSFAQPLTTQFRLFVRNRETLVPPNGYFPGSASYSSDSGDPFLRALFTPTFRGFSLIVTRLNVVQHGHIHVYVLYVAVTLIALLIWGSL